MGFLRRVSADSKNQRAALGLGEVVDEVLGVGIGTALGTCRSVISQCIKR